MSDDDPRALFLNRTLKKSPERSHPHGLPNDAGRYARVPFDRDVDDRSSGATTDAMTGFVSAHRGSDQRPPTDEPIRKVGSMVDQ
ncbi:hypothetical protein [Streptomyces longwoodensis]|uniref:hypothetical protein n=1 Tax=Streptomyces longwoodensis TaxID=68231 RepID=UPI0033FE67AC